MWFSKADEDLDDQADYMAVEADVGVALRFLEAAHDTFALLSSHPEMGWQCRLRHAGLASARVLRVKGLKRSSSSIALAGLRTSSYPSRNSCPIFSTAMRSVRGPAAE